MRASSGRELYRLKGDWSSTVRDSCVDIKLKSSQRKQLEQLKYVHLNKHSCILFSF